MRELQKVTPQDEVKVGDRLVDKDPVTDAERDVTVSRVTKTRIFTESSEFDKEGCNPNDRLMRWRVRLFKAVEV
jgi:hypothetical protein